MTTQVSKTNAYAVLGNPQGANVSKTNAYAILTPGAAEADLDVRYKLLAGDYVLAPNLDVRWAIQGYLFGDFNFAYRLGTSTPKYFNVDTFLPANDLTELKNTNARSTWSSGRDLTSSDDPVAEDATTDGAISAQGTTILPSVAAGLNRHFAGDYYFRIWVLPPLLQVQNPRVGVEIPFEIWNAYPEPNTLNTISAIGGTGLTLDLTTPSDFSEIELREVNITIDEDAPIDINANYTFDFTLGDGLFQFLASIADFIATIPDVPIKETWNWLTDVIEAYGSKEQRIALRDSPRRTLNAQFLVENEEVRQAEYNRWYKAINNRIVVPYYQYATQVTQDSLQGSSKIFFDPTLTDMRDAEFAVVTNPQTEEGNLVKFDEVVADGATLDAPLTFDVLQGYIIAPAFTSRLADNSGISMTAVSGSLKITSEVLISREEFARPGSTATITTFDGLNVLDKRPLANRDVPENFLGNYEIIDSETGTQELKSSWPHPFVNGRRDFLIQRASQPIDMDYWRDLLTAVNGQQNPFLLPTWRSDLTQVSNPTAGSSQLLITNTDYVGEYFPYETFKRLQIEVESGIIYRKVLQATDNGDNTATLELDGSFGINPEDINIIKISFLNLVRLNSDKVELSHSYGSSIITLELKQVDQ